MTEAEWDNGSDPRQMIALLESLGPPRRKRKLLLCAVARHLCGSEGEAFGPLLDSVETWAESCPDEVRGATNPRLDLYDAMFRLAEVGQDEQAAARLLALATLNEKGLWAAPVLEACEPAVLADLLREQFGNPLRRARRVGAGLHHRVRGWPAARRPRELLFVRDWAKWLDGLPTKLAQGIQDRRAWEEMPILGDALEEAGCDEPAILSHLRGPAPHARGCWVLDLILGKE